MYVFGMVMYGQADIKNQNYKNYVDHVVSWRKYGDNALLQGMNIILFFSIDVFLWMPVVLLLTWINF